MHLVWLNIFEKKKNQIEEFSFFKFLGFGLASFSNNTPFCRVLKNALQLGIIFIIRIYFEADKWSFAFSSIRMTSNRVVNRFSWFVKNFINSIITLILKQEKRLGTILINSKGILAWYDGSFLHFFFLNLFLFFFSQSYY